MTGDELRVGVEFLERRGQRSLALVGGQEEAAVRRELFGLLPDLDRVKLRRVWRQTEELDAIAVLGKPFIETVAAARYCWFGQRTAQPPI